MLVSYKPRWRLRELCLATLPGFILHLQKESKDADSRELWGHDAPLSIQ